MPLQIQCEGYLFQTAAATVVDGVASFMPEKRDEGKPPGVLIKTTGEERPFKLPDDPDQIGDLIVYLCRVTNKGPERFAFHRFTAAEAMKHGMGFTRKWLTLKPMQPSAPNKSKPLPCLLFQALLAPLERRRGLSLGKALAAPPAPTTAAPAASPAAAPAAEPPTKPLSSLGTWPPPPDAEECLPSRTKLTAYELRLHIFQGRDLPAADDDGVLDAFIVAKLCGCQVESTVQQDTTHPQWYETLTLRAWLPDLDVAPHLTLSVWDKDFMPNDPDDFIGTCRLPIKQALKQPGEKMTDPHWIALNKAGTLRAPASTRLRLRTAQRSRRPNHSERSPLQPLPSTLSRARPPPSPANSQVRPASRAARS